MSNLFRKSVIDKLSSPEQLDRTIKIATPLTWIAILTFGLLILAVFLWSILGSLPTTMDMRGVLLAPGKSNAIFARADGRMLENDYLKPGEKFKRGDKLYSLQRTDGKNISYKATMNGVLGSFLVPKDEPVQEGQEIARFSPYIDRSRYAKQLVLCYLEEEKAGLLRNALQEKRNEAEEAGEDFTGMEAMVYLGGKSVSDAYVRARLVLMDERIASEKNMSLVLGQDNQASKRFLQQGPVVACTFLLCLDEAGEGLAWSRPGHGGKSFNNGTLVEAEVILKVERPLSKVFSQE